MLSNFVRWVVVFCCSVFCGVWRIMMLYAGVDICTHMYESVAGIASRYAKHVNVHTHTEREYIIIKTYTINHILLLLIITRILRPSGRVKPAEHVRVNKCSALVHVPHVVI